MVLVVCYFFAFCGIIFWFDASTVYVCACVWRCMNLLQIPQNPISPSNPAGNVFENYTKVTKKFKNGFPPPKIKE